MVIELNKSLQDSLANLLTSTQSQARNVAFNIQFAALQDTVIKRLNADIVEAEDIQGRQREIERFNAIGKSLTDTRNKAAEFEFFNAANQQRFSDISTLATNASIFVSLGDSDPDTLNADEVASFESFRTQIVTETNRLIELSHPDFFDGNHTTILRSLVDELESLEAVEGTVDDEGTATEDATNDNRRILDLFDEISISAGNAADVSVTLNLMVDNVIAQLDSKLQKNNVDANLVSVEQTLEAEFEVQRLRTEYATFLRSIEIGFDFASASADKLAAAMDPDNFKANNVLSLVL